MFSDRDKINDLLRNGNVVNKKKRNSDISIRLEEEFHFLKFEAREYFRCVHEDDNDFDDISEDNRACNEEIEVRPGQEVYSCPKCGRTIYLEDKNFRFEKYHVNVIEKNIEEFVKNTFRNSEFGYLQKGKLTFGQKKFAFHKFTCDSFIFGVATINKWPKKDLLDWIEIYSYPIVFILFDSAVFSARNILGGRSLTFIDLGSLLALDERIRTEKLSALVEGCTIGTKMKFQASSLKAMEKLEKREIDHNSYEQCVYMLLKSMLDSTDKFGNSYIGSKLPDGFFTISPLIGRKYGFYVYDCKFRYVDERKLTSADYRAICDYIIFIRTSPIVAQSKFRDISGFIVFSDEVRPNDLENTLKYIRARSQIEQRNNPWKGKLIYFETQSLILLAKLLAKNKEEIQQRKIFFYDHLNLFLHYEKLHQETEIEKKGVIHISQNDIKNMIDAVLQRESHEHRLSAEDLIEDLRARGLL